MNINKSNIQLFRDDEFSKRMFNVVSEVQQIQEQNLWLLKDTFLTSEFYAAYIYDNGLLKISRYFIREFFIKNFGALMKAIKIAGTYESYILVLNSALASIDVSFENPDSSHLIINIKNEILSKNWIAKHNTNTVTILQNQTQYPSTRLMFKTQAIEQQILAVYHNNELLKLIPEGIQYPVDSVLAVDVSVSETTVNQVVKMLELLTVNGVFVEVKFNK